MQLCRLFGKSRQSCDLLYGASAVNLFAVNELKCDPCGCLKTANKPDRNERRREGETRKLSNGGQRRNMPQAAQVAQVLLFRLVRSAIFTALGEEVWQQKRLGSTCSISLSLATLALIKVKLYAIIVQASASTRVELNPNQSCNQLARPMQWPPVAYVMANICCLILWKCAANATTLAQVAAPT